MSPLMKGPRSMRANMKELTQNAPESMARMKAIATISKKHNISMAEAQHRQAIRIAQSQMRKK